MEIILHQKLQGSRGEGITLLLANLTEQIKNSLYLLGLPTIEPTQKYNSHHLLISDILNIFS